MDPEKKMKLEKSGYDFDSELLCFVNREAGKIFSSAWIDEKNINTLIITLSLPHSRTTWRIFLNPEEPHDEVRTALIEKYGKTP
jgi:hypothetical protein